MSIDTTIAKRTSELRSRHPTMSEADLLSELFRGDPGLYWDYRQSSLAREAQTPAAKAETPTAKASAESPIPIAVQFELLKCAELADPEKPLSRGLEKVRQALRTARLAS